MKKWIQMIALLWVVLGLTACQSEGYTFREPVETIQRIELVSAESSMQFTVLKTLSDTEKQDFLSAFQQMRFDDYYIGDPMSIGGDAVRLVYQNEHYEIICHHWAEYVADGHVYFVRKNCDNEDFTGLWNRFSATMPCTR